MSVYESLSVKHRKFVDEYLIDLNATAAYKRAGYEPLTEKASTASSSRLLASVKVQQAIEERRSDQMIRTGISADWVLNSLRDVAERSMTVVPVMIKVDGEWEESGEYRFDSSGANKALELLGKHLKLFTEKTEIENTGEVTVKFNVPRPKYKKQE